MVSAVAFYVYRLAAPQLYESPVDLQQETAANKASSDADRMVLRRSDDPAALSLAQLPATGTRLYLGETFSAHITLANLAAMPLANVALKVELTTERGGGAAVLADTGPAPIPALPPGAQHDIQISHDVKELGAHTLACSAVFSTPDGERKYHVQFFKWSSLNPLHVRTKLRALPLGSCTRVLPPASAADATSVVSGSGSDGVASSGAGAHSGMLLLEVGIDNTMQVPMLLPAVRFLAIQGVSAQQVAAEEAHAGLVDATTASVSDASAANPADLGTKSVGMHSSSKQEQDVVVDLVDDTRPQSDVSQPSLSGRQSEPSTSAAVHSTSLPSGGTRNFLWRVQLEGQSPDSPRSVSATTALGRLEVHWQSMDGHSGRLKTLPILGLPLATAGRDVRLALHGLPQVALLEVPFEVQLRVVRRPRTTEQQQQQQQTDHLGPLHIIHMDTAPDVATSSSHEGGVVVQGSRSVAVGEVSPGSSAVVPLKLVALRAGVQRVPAFVVVSGDGRPLDTVHDLHLLVAAC